MNSRWQETVIVTVYSESSDDYSDSSSDSSSESCFEKVDQRDTSKDSVDYTIKRRSANSEIREDKKAHKHQLRKEKIIEHNSLSPSDFTARIKSVIGKKCCKNNCLSNPHFGFEVAKIIHNDWDISQLDKIKKLISFLQECHTSTPTHNSRVIAGKYYVLKLEVNGEIFYPCPTAFRKMIHVNSDTLMESTTNDQPDIVRKSVKSTKITKKYLANQWIKSHIIPQCSLDEVEPTKFLRCDLFANPKSANDEYNTFLTSKYNNSSPLSVCSASTFERVIESDFPHILWGSSEVFHFVISFSFFLVRYWLEANFMTPQILSVVIVIFILFSLKFKFLLFLLLIFSIVETARIYIKKFMLSNRQSKS